MQEFISRAWMRGDGEQYIPAAGRGNPPAVSSRGAGLRRRFLRGDRIVSKVFSKISIAGGRASLGSIMRAESGFPAGFANFIRVPFAKLRKGMKPSPIGIDLRTPTDVVSVKCVSKEDRETSCNFKNLLLTRIYNSARGPIGL